jgi:hypothetical protein
MRKPYVAQKTHHRRANGKALIEAFSISGMVHGVPLATTRGESYGAAGAFFLDVGIFLYALHRALLAPARISR